MAARPGYNMNSSAVKRIMQEARELANDPCTDYTAAPLEDDIFEWHCTIRGPSGTEFDGGLYHFRILLPTEYPFRPPSVMMLTPNGRFELNTKICISFTSYHEELWQPAWGVRTAIIGLQGFLPLKGTAAVGVGALEYPPTERKRLAALSRDWVCPTCKKTNLECLPDPAEGSLSPSTMLLHETLQNNQHEHPSLDAADKVFKVLDAATATTIADPPAPPFPVNGITSPPIIAPRPMRPIDAASIIIPATPSRPSTPLPPVAPTLPVDMHPEPAPSPLSARTLPVPTPTPARSEQSSRIQTPMPSQQTLPLVIRRSNPRPPILLDTAICVLLVSVIALLWHRIV
ncbi:ubiquitin-conjugating enzyme/RWD-like protein [Cytidiella melzeri]|nr:ubiquitin-conjugating enzyme/RWD-like protein [Cytidiella melzeri]